MLHSLDLSPEYRHPAAPRGSQCDVFIKLGGSILDHEAQTAALIPILTEVGGRHRTLILTGGGKVVKRIKSNQRAHGTPFYSCWRAGVLCLEVNSYLLASYSKSLTVVSSLAELRACFESGSIGVFAPAGAMLSSLHLIPDWEETTDSIGLHFASALGAQRYVIVSDVDGIYEGRPELGTCKPPIPRVSVAELERLTSSKLDSAFPQYFRRHPLPTVIVNGSHPDRLRAAIDGEPVIGTEISLSGEP